MKADRNRRIVPIAVLVTMLIASICVWSIIVEGIPSTGSMVKRFEAHRSTLDQLRAMLDSENGVTFVSGSKDSKQVTGSLPTNTKRWQEYSLLMEQAGVNVGLELAGEGHIYFWTSSTDGFLSGEKRGFAYCPQRPRPINPDLDRGRLRDRQDLQYQPITGNWYIVHDS
jgi:hypothetical protein